MTISDTNIVILNIYLCIFYVRNKMFYIHICNSILYPHYSNNKKEYYNK